MSCFPTYFRSIIANLIILQLFLGFNIQAQSSCPQDLAQLALTKMGINLDELLKKQSFNPSEISQINLIVSEQSDLLDHPDFTLYLAFIQSLKGKAKEKAIVEMKFLNQTNPHQSSSLAQFYAQKKMAQHLYALYQSQATREEFMNIFFGCRANTLNTYNTKGNQLFAKYFIPSSLIVAGAGYVAYQHKKEKNERWFEELFYDIAFTYINAFFAVRIQTNPFSSLTKKSFYYFMSMRTAGIVDFLAFPTFFPLVSNKEVEKRIEEIKQIEDKVAFTARMNSLSNAFEQRNIVTATKDALIFKAKELLQSGEKVELKYFDWKTLKVEDLDRWEVREKLANAIMQEVYEQKMHVSKIKMGDLGSDRYVSGTLLNLGLVPLILLRNDINYKILCFGQNNQMLSFAQSLAWMGGMNFFLQQIYYLYRNYTINQ